MFVTEIFADLRTNDQEERIKRETNLEKFEALRRMAASASLELQIFPN